VQAAPAIPTGELHAPVEGTADAAQWGPARGARLRDEPGREKAFRTTDHGEHLVDPQCHAVVLLRGDGDPVHVPVEDVRADGLAPRHVRIGEVPPRERAVDGAGAVQAPAQSRRLQRGRGHSLAVDQVEAAHGVTERHSADGKADARYVANVAGVWENPADNERNIQADNERNIQWVR